MKPAIELVVLISLRTNCKESQCYPHKCLGCKWNLRQLIANVYPKPQHYKTPNP